jgi:hypothetical protein
MVRNTAAGSTILIGIIIIPPNNDFIHEINSPQKKGYSRIIQAMVKRKTPNPKLSIQAVRRFLSYTWFSLGS